MMIFNIINNNYEVIIIRSNALLQVPRSNAFFIHDDRYDDANNGIGMQKKKKMMMIRDMNMIKMKGSVFSDKQLQTHIRSKYNEDDDDDDRRRGNIDDDRDVGDYNDNNYDRRIIKDDDYGKDRQKSLIRRDKVISKR